MEERTTYRKQKIVLADGTIKEYTLKQKYKVKENAYHRNRDIKQVTEAQIDEIKQVNYVGKIMNSEKRH